MIGDSSLVMAPELFDDNLKSLTSSRIATRQAVNRS